MGKLDAKDVRKIIDDRNFGITFQEIADEISCNRSYVGKIYRKYKNHTEKQLGELVYPPKRKKKVINKGARPNLWVEYPSGSFCPNSPIMESVFKWVRNILK